MPLITVRERDRRLFRGRWGVYERGGARVGRVHVVGKTVRYYDGIGTRQYKLGDYTLRTSWVGTFGYKTSCMTQPRCPDVSWLPKLLSDDSVLWQGRVLWYDDIDGVHYWKNDCSYVWVRETGSRKRK